MRVILLRHGETLWNKDFRLQGHGNSELSRKGIKQARAIKPFVQQLAPTHIFSSDLGRAIQTAGIIGYPDAVRCQDLRELNMGEWTGCCKPEIIKNNSQLYADWRAGSYTPPNGENWFDFCNRIESAMDRIISESNGDILTVVHSGVIRAACKIFVNLSPEYLLPASPGTLTVFNVDRYKKIKLEAYNIGTFIPAEDAAD